MTDFDRAIDIAFSQSADAQLKSQAEQYLSRLQNSDEGWNIGLSTIKDAPQQYRNDPTMFWCLCCLVQVFPVRIQSMSVDDRKMICDLLMECLGSRIGTDSVANFVKSKYAQLMVVVFEHEWPANWPQFWPKLFSLLPTSDHMIDMFLRILDTIDERIVDQSGYRSNPKDNQRRSAIKDAMRSQVVRDLTATWYNILGAYHKTRPDIAEHCLRCMQTYIEWIDIQLLTTESYVNLLFFLFNNERLREDACECVFELVSKRMEDPSPKLQLIERLNICQVLPNISKPIVDELERLKGEDWEGEDFGLKVAKLATTVGMELLDVIEKAQALMSNNQISDEARQLAYTIKERSGSLLEDLLPTLFSLFGVPCIPISATLLDFITQYVAKIKREATLTPNHMNHIMTLLGILQRSVRYPDKYDFAHPCNDFETTVLEHRKHLFTVFKNLCRRSPDIGNQFIMKIMDELVKAPKTWNEVEADLSLFYQMGEGVKGEPIVDPNSVYSISLKIILNSNITSHSHPSVLLMFFEICDRYHPFFQVSQDCLPLVLSVFLDQRGIRNPNQSVAFRAAYLFKLFVNNLKAVIVRYVDQVFAAVKEFISNTIPKSSESLEELLNLHEALSILLGTDQMVYDNIMLHLQELVTPHINSVQSIVNSGALRGPGGDSAAEVVANQLAMLTWATKGFNSTLVVVKREGNNIERKDIGEVFFQIMSTVLAAFAAGPQYNSIREKTVLYVHRMVDMMGEHMLESIPQVTTALLDSCPSVTDAPRAIRIPVQLAKRVRAKAVPSISSIFLPIVTKVFSITNIDSLKQQNDVFSEDVRQHAELLRTYYNFLYCLMTTSCSEVLTCEINRGHLDKVLQTIIQGCSTHPELEISKTCVQVCTEMVREWKQMDGFAQYVYERIIPASLDLLTKPHFNTRDGKANNVLAEVVTLHKMALSSFGAPFLQVMQTLYSEVPEPGRSQLLQHLQNTDNKVYKNCLKELVDSRRKT